MRDNAILRALSAEPNDFRRNQQYLAAAQRCPPFWGTVVFHQALQSGREIF